MSVPKLISLQIVGLITSLAYQKAKYYLQICSQLPHIYSQPVARGLLEFDWHEYLTKQRRKHGGQLWALQRPVAVYYNNKFIGSDTELSQLISSKYFVSTVVHDSYFHDQRILEYQQYIFNTKRIFIYLTVRIENGETGSLIFQLYSDLLPATCEVFKNYCASKVYENTGLHRLCAPGWIQGGALANGHHGSKRYKMFPDESFCISHDRRGVLSMANHSRHTNHTQFFVTLTPSPWMDRRYVAFGQLVEGVDILAAIESVHTYYERPLKAITVVRCGVLSGQHVRRPEVDSTPSLASYGQGMYGL